MHIVCQHTAGDERSNYGAFKRNMIAGLNSAMSGIVFWGWDIGGFSGPIPTADLYIRSTQMAAFCPIMQYHAESKAEFNQDRTPWNIAERTGDRTVMDVYRYYAHLRMNLIPYIYNESLKAIRNNMPLIRPMVLDYEDDKACALIEDQYMFGEGLLVAPIFGANTHHRKVYLPKGQWVHFFTGERYEGKSYYDVECSGMDFPVFIHSGSIIPMNLCDSLVIGEGMDNKLDVYKNLVFLVPSNDCQVDFEDDLGHSMSLVVNKDEVIATGKDVSCDFKIKKL